MKNNVPRLGLLPSIETAQHDYNLVETAEALERFCLEFGIQRDEHFPHRIATIAFTNGLNLVRLNPDCVQVFMGLLKSRFAPEEIHRITQALIDQMDWDGNWMAKVRKLLASATGQESPTDRLIAMTHLGIAIAKSSSAFAEQFASHHAQMSSEDQFLGNRFAWWSHSDFKPRFASFVEFTWIHYPHSRVVEGVVICRQVAAVLQVARHATDPWSLALWIDNGWSRGREFVHDCADECRRMLEEAPSDELLFCQELYKRCILGSAAVDGTLRLERATLHFFAVAFEGRYARLYCLGEQPRSLVRAAFDFAFWMGIYSSFVQKTDI